jgi:hypothetical protein
MEDETNSAFILHPSDFIVALSVSSESLWFNNLRGPRSCTAKERL